MTIGRTQRVLERPSRNRRRTAVKTAKKAKENSWGRNRNHREIVEVARTNTGTPMEGSSDVARIPANKKNVAAPPTMHFRTIRPDGPARWYASQITTCARYSKVTQ